MLIWNTVEVQILEFHIIIILINLLAEGVGLYNITILENYVYIYMYMKQELLLIDMCNISVHTVCTSKSLQQFCHLTSLFACWSL